MEGVVRRKDGTYDDYSLHSFIMEDEEADIKFRRLICRRAIQDGTMTAEEAQKIFCLSDSDLDK